MQAAWTLFCLIIGWLFLPAVFGLTGFLIAGSIGAFCGTVFGLLVGCVALASVMWAEQEYGEVFLRGAE